MLPVVASPNTPRAMLVCASSSPSNAQDAVLYRAATHCARSPRCVKGVWTTEEHERFLEAMRAYPFGPWKCIADFVGTRSVRQVQSHAQKLREKLSRWSRGLRNGRRRVIRPEHRVDEDVVALWGPLKEIAVPFRAESKVAALATMRVPNAPVAVLSPGKAVKVEDGTGSTDGERDSIDDVAEPFPSVNESLDFLIARLDRRPGMNNATAANANANAVHAHAASAPVAPVAGAGSTVCV